MTAFGAVLLAAGQARRFGEDKLLKQLNGATIVAHAIEAARQAPVGAIAIVCRPGGALEQACRRHAAGDARIVITTCVSAQLSDSLRAGLANVQGEGGTFVFLGDMPLIPRGLATQMAERLGDTFAVQPRFGGRPGHPVLLSARAAALAAKISGDRGAGEILRQHSAEVTYIDVTDEGVALDVDTKADYEALMRRGEV